MNYVLVTIIILLVISVLRLSGRETYKKWSGGVFYILDDDSLIPAQQFVEIPKGKEAKGIFIAGVKKENMPFVDFTIFDKEDKIVLIGSFAKEENNGVRIILAKNFEAKNHKFFNIEILTPYLLKGEKYQFYTLYV
ncbi:MAG: hypothetical protein WC827_02735 [Candidatus Paceibacterota bacterium]|jgi:hypothetical protein